MINTKNFGRAPIHARILVYSIIIILISIAVTALTSVVIIVNDTLDEKGREMHRICLLLGDEIAQGLEAGAGSTLCDYAARCAEFTGFRVTLIDPDGEVLADSTAGENYIYMDREG